MSADRSPAAAIVVDRDHPWPGLGSFRESDKDFFFGRDTEARQLAGLVQRERLTILYGLSGLGKSSLLHAGLFPRLRNEGVLPVSVRLDHDPQSQPLMAQVQAALAAAIIATGASRLAGAEDDSLWEELHRREHAFWDARNRPLTPLLVFDQFEEIFTLGRRTEERAVRSDAFLAALADLVEGRPPKALRTRVDTDPDLALAYTWRDHRYKILISLREDYLAELDDLREGMPSVSVNRFRLQRLTSAQALDAVVGAGAHLLPDVDGGGPSLVARRIVAFVGGADAQHRPRARALADLEVDPALLSLVCNELNAQRLAASRAAITTELLDGNRAQIFDRFYDDGLRDVAPALRLLIEDRLVTATGLRDSLALDNVLAAGVPAADVETLVQRRLLRLEWRGDTARVELTHDVLVDTVLRRRETRRSHEEHARREALLAAERVRERAARVEAEARERDARRRLRTSRILALMFLSLAVAAAVAVAWAWSSEGRARTAEAQALFGEALARRDAGDRASALAHLAAGLRLGRETTSMRVTALDLLQRRTWPLPVVDAPNCSFVAPSFSPDGTRIIACEGLSASVFDARTGERVLGPFAHAQQMAGATFTVDGQRIVTVGGDAIKVWDARTGALLVPPVEMGGMVFGRFTLAVSPDGHHVVTQSPDGPVLWSTEPGVARRRKLDLPRHQLVDASFTADGRSVVVGATTGARRWDTQTIRRGTTVGPALRGFEELHRLAVSPDGRFLITDTTGSLVQLDVVVWDLRSGNRVAVLAKQSAYHGVGFTGDGRRALVWNSSNISIWDTSSWQPLATWHAPERLTRVVPNADGSRIITLRSNIARVWDTQSRREVTEPLRHETEVHSAAFSPDGGHIVTGTSKSARVWDVRSGAARPLTLKHGLDAYHSALTPDGHWLVAAEDRQVAIWNARDGRVARKVPVDGRVLALGSSGARAVVLSGPQSARLWDLRPSGGAGIELKHNEPIDSASFSSDERWIVTASAEHARVWAAQTGDLLAAPIQIPGRQARVTVPEVRISPDGLSLCVSSKAGSQVWDVRTNRQRVTATRAPSGWPFAPLCVFSRDGQQVLTEEPFKRLQLWDLHTGGQRAEILGSYYKIAVLSPDGRSVVTASEGTARVWSAASGEPVTGAMTSADQISAIEYRDARRALMVSSRGTVRMWDMQLGKPISETFGARVSTGDDDGYWWKAAAHFSEDGQRVAVRGLRLRSTDIFDVPAADAADSESIARLAEAVAGLRLNSDGAVVEVPNGASILRHLGQERGDTPSRGATLRAFTRWFLADRWDRPISPFATLTVPELIRQRVNDNDPLELEELRRDFSGHPALPQAASVSTR